jgi:hypothetical protein
MLHFYEDLISFIVIFSLNLFLYCDILKDDRFRA